MPKNATFPDLKAPLEDYIHRLQLEQLNSSWNELKDAKITDKNLLQVMKYTVKWLEQDLEQEMDLIEYESKNFHMELLKLRIQYARLMINGSEDAFLEWVAKIFRKREFQKLNKMNSLARQLAEKALTDMDTDPIFMKVPDLIRQDSIKRYTEVLQIHRNFELIIKKLQNKIEFYLPQAIMRREN